MLHCSDGISDEWYLLLCQMWHLRFWPKRYNFLPKALRVLKVLSDKLMVCFRTPFTEEWLSSSHATIKPWLMECYWWCLCYYTRTIRVAIGLLMTSLAKALPTVLLGMVSALVCILYPFPRLMLWHHSTSETYRNPLVLHGLVVAQTCGVNLLDLIQTGVCAFLIHVKSTWNFHSWTTSSRDISSIKGSKGKKDVSELTLDHHSKVLWIFM